MTLPIEPDPFPQDGESREQYERRLWEMMFTGGDWDLRLQAHEASFLALNTVLAGEKDPSKAADLMRQRRESLSRWLGCGAIIAYRNDILAERKQFEARFGTTE